MNFPWGERILFQGEGGRDTWQIGSPLARLLKPLNDSPAERWRKGWSACSAEGEITILPLLIFNAPFFSVPLSLSSLPHLSHFLIFCFFLSLSLSYSLSHTLLLPVCPPSAAPHGPAQGRGRDSFTLEDRSFCSQGSKRIPRKYIYFCFSLALFLSHALSLWFLPSSSPSAEPKCSWEVNDQRR